MQLSDGVHKLVIKQLAREYPAPEDGPRSVTAYQTIQLIHEINELIQKLELMLQTQLDGCKRKLKKIHFKLKDMCYHPVVSYNPDPSGNNDSWQECDICGKIW